MGAWFSLVISRDPLLSVCSGPSIELGVKGPEKFRLTRPTSKDLTAVAEDKSSSGRAAGSSAASAARSLGVWRRGGAG